MDASAAMPAQPPSSAPTGAEDAAARTPFERRAAMLEELAELNMQLARAIGRQVLAAVSEDAPADDEPAPPPIVTGDPVLALSRASRAVRMTLDLWARFERDNRAQEIAAVAATRESRRVEAEDRRARAGRMVERIAQDHFEGALPREADDAQASAAIERLAGEARERLADEDVYGDLPDRPLSEIVARLCADLGLSPDWARLAGEDWARAEIEAGAHGQRVGAPLAPFAAGGVEPPPPNPSAPPVAGPTTRWRRRREARAAIAAAPPARNIRITYVDATTPKSVLNRETQPEGEPYEVEDPVAPGSIVPPPYEPPPTPYTAPPYPTPPYPTPPYPTSPYPTPPAPQPWRPLVRRPPEPEPTWLPGEGPPPRKRRF